MTCDPIYVPITLEALVVGKEPQQPPFVDLALKYDMLPADNPFCSQIANDAFAVSGGRKGIHLHWIMPDALLKGEQQTDGSVCFYDLPDQWVIQRLCFAGGQLETRSWLVESTAVSFEEAHTANGLEKTTIPCFRTDKNGSVPGGPKGEMYCYLGSAQPLSAPPASAYLEHLTAVGSGDPLFAAFYPYCKTVFGFYDDMKDAKAGQYSYLVTGYYRDEKKDPIRIGGSERLKDLAWTYTGNPPSKSVLHGQVKKILWEGSQKEYPSSIPTQEISVSIGNTSAETLAAHYSGEKKASGLERGLTALQYHFLSDTQRKGKADALLQFEEQLHAKQFSAHEGGCRWRLGTMENPSDPFDLELPPQLYQEILALNQLQEERDALAEKAVSLQREIFDAWYLYVQIQSDPWNNHQNASFVDFLQRVEEKTTELEQLNKTLLEKETALKSHQEALAAAVEKRSLRLHKLPGEPYYTANQPVVQLGGAGVGRSFRQGFQSEKNGTLPCRTSPITQLTVLVDGTEENLTGQDLPLLCRGLEDALPPEAKELLAEAIFADTDLSPVLASFLESKRNPGIGQGLEAAAAGTVEQAVKAAQESLTGKPYQIAVRNWRQPWNPLMMAWTFALYPSRTNLEQDDAFAAYTLGDMDLEPRSETFSDTPIFFNGTTMLSPHGTENLGEALKEALESLPQSEGKAALPRVRQLAQRADQEPFLSQQADGFDAILQMKRQLPMLPIVKCGSASQELVRRIDSLLQQTDYLPVPDSFFLPVRAGALKLKRLRLIDSFGQYKDIPVERQRIRIAEPLRMAAENTALLRPRLVQPCRLEFRWLSHQYGREAMDVNSTPVFGFVTADFIDRSLQIYDGSGIFLGSLKHSKTLALWIDQFGRQTDPEAIPSTHLRHFVQSFLEEDTSALWEVLEVLEQEFQHSAPDHTDPFSQLCFGRVMALCRGMAALRGKGEPIISQALQQEGSTYGYEKEKLPIRLGDIRREQNGLLGFYIGAGSPETYRHFCVPWQQPQSPNSSYVVFDPTLEASLSDPPIELTLLMDPLGSLTLRTGFLPQREETLPPVFYQKQISEIHFRFQAAPILAIPDDLHLPLPGKKGDTWNYAYWESTSSPRIISELQEPSNLVGAGKQQILEGLFVMKKEE